MNLRVRIPFFSFWHYLELVKNIRVSIPGFSPRSGKLLELRVLNLQWI
jgi:hypothetical protein